MTASIYTPDATGRCTICQRTEAEHAPEAWTVTLRACPPADAHRGVEPAMVALAQRTAAAFRAEVTTETVTDDQIRELFAQHYSADGRAFGAVQAAPALTAAAAAGRVTRALQVDDLLALAARIKDATEVSGGDADQLAEGCEMAVVALRNLAADLEQEREAHRLTAMRWQASREASEALGAELTAAREEAEVTLHAAQAEISRLTGIVVESEGVIADHRAIARLAIERQAAEIADLKARLLGMTECAAAAARDANAALVREGVALARLRAAPVLDADDCKALDALWATLPSTDRASQIIAGMLVRSAWSRASVQTALESLTETVTGRSYQEVSADLDAQVAEHPDEIADQLASDYPPYDLMGSMPAHLRAAHGADIIDETLVIDDPDASERVSPDEIAAALKAHREQEHLAGAPFVALGDLVSDLLAVTRDIDEIERVALGSEHPGEMRATSRRIEPLLVRRDTIERALVRAVAR